jgi:hypothetical protein
MSDKDYLALSDEEFANELPPTVEATNTGSVPDVETPDPGTQQTAEATVVETPDPATQTVTTVETPPATETHSGTGEQGGEETEPAVYTPGSETQVSDKPAATTEQVDPNKPAEQSTTVDYKEAYGQIMAPLKANGKTIELRSIDELRSLAQMGANYTRKMQDIAPHRKILLMLENNGLLDESKLSFYIDLEKKNPEAIKKLVAESGIDPLEIDTSVPAKYQASNHTVTDEELGFRSVLDEVCASPEGQQTVAVINSTWDQASKEQLWKDPSLISVFHQQRENGIYARITSEVERLKALGQIPVGTSFLSAYKLVGDHLHASNAFADLVKPSPSNQAVHTPAVPTPVAVKTVTPKAPVVNPAVAAASTPRSTPKRAQTIVNPLAVSDEDFMKTYEQFKNRV